MFDKITAENISKAPATAVLASGDAARELALSFVKLASLRLNRASRGASDDAGRGAHASGQAEVEAPDGRSAEGAESWSGIAGQLVQIADAYEVIAASSSGEHRAASAFVSATAHLILARETESDETYAEVISPFGVHPALSASILFLIADQHADAAEATKLLTDLTCARACVATLAAAILSVAKGRLVDAVLQSSQAVEEAAAEAVVVHEVDIEMAAFLVVVGAIAKAVHLMAKLALEGSNQTDEGEPVNAVLRSVVEACSTGEAVGGNVALTVGSLPGPVHLAKLLLACSPVLYRAALINTRIPPQIDSETWKKWLSTRAAVHPYLWPNHRQFVDQCGHFPGISGVLVLPTGSGKTTISSLKIAATLAGGKSVVFLAPTHALAEQMVRDLDQLFPTTLFQALISDGLDEVSGDRIARIDVMTPEGFLAAMSYRAEQFVSCGLIIFDECHLLSAASNGGRRSVDGMLSVIGASRQIPGVDFLLLSAMLNDGQVLADWIADLTGRRCIFLDMLWKPSRQARGVVVFQRSELGNAKRSALRAQDNVNSDRSRRRQKPLRDLGKDGQACLRVAPCALWGLSHNWLAQGGVLQTSLQRLLNSKVQLKGKIRNRRLDLLPNANAVATAIALATASQRMKTIVFVNNKSHTTKVVREINAAMSSTQGLTQDEQALADQITEELGSLSHSYVLPTGCAVPHNASMLRIERELAERIFQRQDGASVIVATPTLAQGLNLPAHVAILAGDKRADGSVRQELLVHEVLNAAARAGRAGHLSNGIVLLVPEPIVEVATNEAMSPIARGKLIRLLPEDDRCVPMVDPLEAILDQITVGSVDGDTEYLVNRMSAMRIAMDGDSKVELFEMRKTFGAWYAKRRDTESEFGEKIQALNARVDQVVQQGVDVVLAIYASKTGLPIHFFEDLQRRLLDNPVSESSVSCWLDWIVDWLRDCSASFAYFVQRSKSVTLSDSDDFEDASCTLDESRAALHAWIDGKPMAEIEAALGGKPEAGKPSSMLLPLARDLALRVMGRELSYAASVVGMVARDLTGYQSEYTKDLLEKLPVAFRRGLNSPALVSYANQRRHVMSRVVLHRQYAQETGDLWLDLDGLD